MATTARPLIINGIDELRAQKGADLGAGEWHQVTQDQINAFADATGDHQWIHVDVERAKSGPFKGTIAHGYLTLSLLPILLRTVLKVEGMRMGVNYGANKVRFPAPVPAGANVRAAVKVADVEDVSGGVQATMVVTIEVEGQDKPGCVAEVVYRYYA